MMQLFCNQVAPSPAAMHLITRLVRDAWGAPPPCYPSKLNPMHPLHGSDCLWLLRLFSMSTMREEGAAAVAAAAPDLVKPLFDQLAARNASPHVMYPCLSILEDLTNLEDTRLDVRRLCGVSGGRGLGRVLMDIARGDAARSALMWPADVLNLHETLMESAMEVRVHVSCSGCYVPYRTKMTLVWRATGFRVWDRTGGGCRGSSSSSNRPSQTSCLTTLPCAQPIRTWCCQRPV